MRIFKQGKKVAQKKEAQVIKPTTNPPIDRPIERHECSICGDVFPTADELSKHFPNHKELFESIEKKLGKGEKRNLGETIKFEDYLSFQHTEATASDLETLIMTEAGIRSWGRRKEFMGMKWIGVIIGGVLGLVIVVYIMMELMPGLFGG